MGRAAEPGLGPTIGNEHQAHEQRRTTGGHPQPPGLRSRCGRQESEPGGAGPTASPSAPVRFRFPAIRFCSESRSAAVRHPAEQNRDAARPSGRCQIGSPHIEHRRSGRFHDRARLRPMNDDLRIGTVLELAESVDRLTECRVPDVHLAVLGARHARAAALATDPNRADRRWERAVPHHRTLARRAGAERLDHQTAHRMYGSMSKPVASAPTSLSSSTPLDFAAR